MLTYTGVVSVDNTRQAGAGGGSKGGVGVWGGGDGSGHGARGALEEYAWFEEALFRVALVSNIAAFRVRAVM